jgi:predicted nucleic acid-binding protein
MTVFVDTSAIFALVDESDQDHPVAASRLLHLISEQASMVVSNYVIVETCALLQRRIGLKAVRTFREDILPLLITTWVTERQHELGLASLVRSDRRKLSLVDCVSFEVMRDHGLRTAFAFDHHFADEGFDCDIPAARSH